MTPDAPDNCDALLIDEILGGIDTTAAGPPPLESADMPTARVLRAEARRRLLRIKQREALQTLVEALPAPGEALHVVSAAKFDFWTWVPAIADWLGHIDALYCSTWTTCRAHCASLFELWDAGKIGRAGFLTGLYFKRRETAVYSFLLQGIRRRGGQYRAFPNHAKVLLLSNVARDAWLTVEGSANLTSNPRLEQYVITNDRTLHDFHRQWFDEMLQPVPANLDVGPKDEQQPRAGYSQRRAGLGVLSVRRDKPTRKAILTAKAEPNHDTPQTRAYAADLAELIRQWAPELPAGLTITCPPQGASYPSPHYGESLARAVAGELGRPFRQLLQRDAAKTHHGRAAALDQSTFTVPDARPPSAIVIDDLITTGATMRQSLAALRAAGIPAWGFAYNGS